MSGYTNERNKTKNKMKKLLLCVPLLFSCGEESKDINIEEDKNNTEQSDNTDFFFLLNSHKFSVILFYE